MEEVPGGPAGEDSLSDLRARLGELSGIRELAPNPYAAGALCVLYLLALQGQLRAPMPDAELRRLRQFLVESKPSAWWGHDALDDKLYATFQRALTWVKEKRWWVIPDLEASLIQGALAGVRLWGSEAPAARALTRSLESALQQVYAFRRDAGYLPPSPPPVFYSLPAPAPPRVLPAPLERQGLASFGAPYADSPPAEPMPTPVLLQELPGVPVYGDESHSTPLSIERGESRWEEPLPEPPQTPVPAPHVEPAPSAAVPPGEERDRAAREYRRGQQEQKRFRVWLSAGAVMAAVCVIAIFWSGDEPVLTPERTAPAASLALNESRMEADGSRDSLEMTRESLARQQVEQLEATAAEDGNPPTAEQLQRLGNLHLGKLREPDRAAMFYEELIDRYPQWARDHVAHLYLAKSYELMGDYARAALVYETMLEIFPSDTAEHLAAESRLSNLRRGPD